MKRGLLVSVGQNDILDGFPCSCTSCPVAIAVRRAFPWGDFGPPELTVSSKEILIDGILFHVPRSARNFIRKFDRKNKVQPFNFWLRESLD
jgi:hypothetical protein